MFYNRSKNRPLIYVVASRSLGASVESESDDRFVSLSEVFLESNWAIPANGSKHATISDKSLVFIVLQINPSCEQPVAHSELNLIVTSEGRRQDDLRLSRVDYGRVDNRTILILYIKDIVRMVNCEGQGVVLDVNHGWFDGGFGTAIT